MLFMHITSYHFFIFLICAYQSGLSGRFMNIHAPLDWRGIPLWLTPCCMISYIGSCFEFVMMQLNKERELGVEGCGENL